MLMLHTLQDMNSNFLYFATADCSEFKLCFLKGAPWVGLSSLLSYRAYRLLSYLQNFTTYQFDS